MKKIEAFKTERGALFEDKESAIQEEKLEIRNSIRNEIKSAADGVNFLLSFRSFTTESQKTDCVDALEYEIAKINAAIKRAREFFNSIQIVEVKEIDK